MADSYSVITVGSATVDAFADVESELIKIKTTKNTEELIAYPSGSKLLIKKLSFETGGGGTNSAAALSRLGLRTAYIGKIGDDENSKVILEMLRREKIDFLGKRVEGVSGFSVILKSIEDDRSILAFKGVNNDLRYEELPLRKIKAKWFYFSSMVGESFKTLEKLAAFAEKNHIKIAFNPSNYLAEKGTLFIKEILSRTEVLILNKEEAELLAGKGPCDELVRRLMEFGPKIVVVTDGKNGAYTIENKWLYHVYSESSIKVVETTGAGDAFAASFLAGIIMNKGVDYSLKLGQINAESVIQYIGAKNILLTYKEAARTLSDSRVRLEKRKI